MSLGAMDGSFILAKMEGSNILELMLESERESEKEVTEDKPSSTWILVVVKQVNPKLFMTQLVRTTQLPLRRWENLMHFNLWRSSNIWNRNMQAFIGIGYKPSTISKGRVITLHKLRTLN